MGTIPPAQWQIKRNLAGRAAGEDQTEQARPCPRLSEHLPAAPLRLPVRCTKTGSRAQAGQRPVRRTTRAADERPRHRANREARGAGALRSGADSGNGPWSAPGIGVLRRFKADHMRESSEDCFTPRCGGAESDSSQL